MSGKSFPRESILARRVLRSSALLISAITILALIASISASVSGARNNERASVVDLMDKLEPSLALAAWNVNSSAVQVILDALTGQPGVAAARFSGDMLRLVSPADRDFDSVAQGCDQVLYHDLAGYVVMTQPLPRGEVTVCIQHQSLLRGHFWSLLLRQALPLFAAILLTSGVFLWLIRRMVLERISVISSHLGDAADQQNQPVLIGNDELDLLDQKLVTTTRSLRSERDLIRAIVDNITPCIALTDHTYRITRTNASFDRLILDDVDLDQRQRLDKIFPGISAVPIGEAKHVESDLPHLCQSHFEAYRADLDADESGGGILFVFNDLTKMKELEQESLHAQKMSAIGNLAGGVAHDFNNALAVIIGSAEMALDCPDMPETTRSYIKQINRSAMRAAGVTDKLLTFARRQYLQEKLVDPGKLVSAIQDLARPMTGPSITFQTDIRSVDPVLVDENHLEAALLNLIVNARDALGGRGTITLTTREHEIDGQRMIALSVIDDGPGIPGALLSKVQEPFFTTKAKHKGTGLGLSTVAGFAEQSGGFLKIDSNANPTKVSIYLPCAATSADQVVPVRHGETGPGAKDLRVCIAIIDDEKEFADTLRSLLSSHGAEVRVFSGSKDLLSDADLGRFALFVCDVVLVGENGLDVLSNVRARGCDAPFLFISGNVPHELRDSLMDTQLAILTKPFTHDALLGTIRQVLGRA